MKILIVFGSTEGQTRKICQFSLDHLVTAGHAVALCPADSAEDMDPVGFDAVILAASVHAGHYQSNLLDFAERYSSRLDGMPTLFLSVSLSAAGDDKDDWDGLAKMIDKMIIRTGWTPSRRVPEPL